MLELEMVGGREAPEKFLGTSGKMPLLQRSIKINYIKKDSRHKTFID